jgi:isoleucyl-tRNA synthetase
VWTTTPWTLPSNLLVAARADLPYVGVDGPEGARYWLAEAAVPRYAAEIGPVREHRDGNSFLGRSYTPPFPFAGPGAGRYRVVLDDMVTAEDGTGFVHIAPSFGPDDQRVGQREGVGPFDPLDARAVFTGAVPPVTGKGFKAADPILLEALKKSGLLVRSETIRHTYPFCWRCGTPLIYRALDSWFVRTSRRTGPLVAYNATVEWHPAHLRDGRFGNFLTEAKDWALSRNRFWGTPLPVWLCPKGHATCIGSFAELAERTGHPLPEGFDPHRAGVDPIRFPCPTCGEEARREPYTIDGWYDSGSAPFAQFHYPFEPGPFDPTAPLDFVAEGLDQTRGWFYTLHVLSTALFDRPAYRVCVANGMILDEAGQKMSKSKGNVLDPMEILERHGGDAARWAFLTVDYTEPARFGDAAFRRAGGRTLGTLLNVLAFYKENAEADGIPVPTSSPTVTAVLDRWILSRLDGTIETVTEALESSEYRDGALALQAFVDDLSLWWLRRSRGRFWEADPPEDRVAAHRTLSFTLSTLARLMAPFTPFLAEHVHLTVHRRTTPTAEDSVHLTRWPWAIHQRDAALEAAMGTAREEVEVGRELRQRAQIRSRTPLPEFVLTAPRSGPSELDALIADELNVLSVRRAPPSVAAELLDTDWVLRSDAAGALVAALPRKAPAELVEEGWRREGLRRLQILRKDLQLGYTERIALRVRATGALHHALARTPGRLEEELLLDSLDLAEGPPPAEDGWHTWEIDGEHLAARRVES